MDNRPTSQATRNYSGLDLEEEISAPLEAELFFLTSLFIELIDPIVGERKAQSYRHESDIRLTPTDYGNFVRQTFRRPGE
jgi:hypothetical protein